jgi:hypothetical protein
MNTLKANKIKLTRAQSQALKAYQFAESQEDRYLGSVFVSHFGQIEYREKTRKAYEACKALGMTYEHGL